MRRRKMSWHELRRVEKSCVSLKKAGRRWDEKRWEKLKWHVKRREQSWSAEKSWEWERRPEMGWGEMRWKKLRRQETSWDEMGWHKLWWQWDAVSNFQEKLRCDENRWNEKRFNVQKTWHQIETQEIVAAKHRRLAWHLWAQPFLRSIGYKRFKFETSAPGLPGYYLYFIYIYVKTYHWSTHFQTRAWLLPFVTRMWIQPVGRQYGPVLSDGQSSKAVTMPKVRPRRDRSRWADNKMNKSRHVKTLHMHHLPAHLPLIWSLGNVAKDLRGLLMLILQQYTTVT